MSIQRRSSPFLTDISERSKNGESNEITKNAEDKLVYANVESHFGNNMISSIEQLHTDHGHMSLPRLSLHHSLHRPVSSFPTIPIPVESDESQGERVGKKEDD